MASQSGEFPMQDGKLEIEKITINVNVKDEEKTIEIKDDATTNQLRDLIAKEFMVDADRICLIFSGKMMDDQDTLQTCNIKNGSTVSVLVKTAEIGCQADISATPFGLGLMGGLPGLGSLGMGATNFMDFQAKVQSEFFNNSDMFKQMLENPLIQGYMNSPELMHTLTTSSPYFQTLMTCFPDFRETVNNPELMRLTRELARNPATLQILSKHHGGTETTNDSNENKSCSVEQSDEGNYVANPSTSQSPFGILNNPSMTSLLQQISQNPQLMSDMLSTPYVQHIMQALVANPSLANDIITNNPLLINNPTLQQQLHGSLPHFLQQMQNPHVRDLITNPQAIGAIFKIQEAMEAIHQVAPNIMNICSQSTASSSAEGNANDAFSQYYTRMMAAFNNQQNPTLPPEQRYHDQLVHLAGMGFTNQETNLEALIATSGDINAAILKLAE